jgi:CIC family chloride channel protein
MNAHNFYDALLEQDHHRLEHVRPPRDLQSWHQLPVSAIANFAPVLLRDLDPATIQKTLGEHPYQQFPVVSEGKLKGVLTRQEADKALAEKRPPTLARPTTCLREATVAKLQLLLIESDTLFVIVLDRKEGDVIGLVTLHDLLRAETLMAQQANEED